MANTRRFEVDKDGYVVDIVNPANSGRFRGDESYCDHQLREIVLHRSLVELFDKFFINLRPMETSYFAGGEYQPLNEEAYKIGQLVCTIVSSSGLNSSDFVASEDYGMFAKHSMAKNTSLSLLLNDIDSLLVDLYKGVGSKALQSVLYTIFNVVKEFTTYMRPELVKEYQDARDLDYMRGIGIPEGYGISGSDCGRGLEAKAHLIMHVCQVQANPSLFSEYTVEFAKRFSQEWECGVESASEMSAFLYKESIRIRRQQEGSRTMKAEIEFVTRSR